MRSVTRSVLVFAAGAVAMLALEAISARRGGFSRFARKLLEMIRPEPVADQTLEARVRRKLARTARNPEAITVSIEHGCVDLRGPVETRERARIVRAISRVRGVDAILDLMTEPQAPSAGAAGRRW
jgi:hypothetical protein